MEIVEDWGKSPSPDDVNPNTVKGEDPHLFKAKKSERCIARIPLLSTGGVNLKGAKYHVIPEPVPGNPHWIGLRSTRKQGGGDVGTQKYLVSIRRSERRDVAVEPQKQSEAKRVCLW